MALIITVKPPPTPLSLPPPLPPSLQAEPSPKSGYWNFLIGPAIYLGLLLLMFCALPIIKWLLFPRRMRPGVYPLYGWVYLR